MSPEKSLTPQIRFKGFTEAWEQRKLGDLLQYEQPQKYIVVSSEYDDSFDTPVLTAGQSFVLGWTNEKTGIKKANPENPVIIFDDFVTSSHYVDFPFKIKSSAMKLLSSTNSTIDIDFSFNLLKQINYIPISHMRHWISMFAQFNVYAPRTNEQIKIGQMFKKLDSLITLHQRKLDALKKIKSALLEKMFPKDGSNIPEIRFTGFTEAWEQRKVADIASSTRGGGTPSTSNKAYWNGEIPWIQSSDLSDGKLFGVMPRKYISTAGLNSSATQLVPKNSIAVVTRVGVGKLAFMPYSYTTSQDFLSLCRIRTEAYFTAYSLYQMLQSDLQTVQGTSIKGMTKDNLLSKSIFVPRSMDEQQQLGLFFSSLDTLVTLHQRKLDALKKIKSALLEKIFV